MGNIVTTYRISNDEKSTNQACGLEKWCHNANVLKKMNIGFYVTVLTNNAPLVKNMCPHANVQSFNEELTHAIKNFNVKGNVCKDTLYKIQILDPKFFKLPVFYLDVDVDISIGRHGSQQLPIFSNISHLEYLYTRFKQSKCVIQATPDHSALINDGVMIVKPNSTYYNKALSIINQSDFNPKYGYESKGLPQTIIDKPLNIVKKARGYWANTWNVVCGASGQGLLAYLTMPSQTFCEPTDWLFRVRHFWANDKPWLSKSCRRYFEFPQKTERCKKYFTNTYSKNCLGREWPIL